MKQEKNKGKKRKWVKIEIYWKSRKKKNLDKWQTDRQNKYTRKERGKLHEFLTIKANWKIRLIH